MTSPHLNGVDTSNNESNTTTLLDSTTPRVQKATARPVPESNPHDSTPIKTRVAHARQETQARLEALYDRTQGFFGSPEARQIRDTLTKAAPYIGVAVGVIGVGVAVSAVRNNMTSVRSLVDSVGDTLSRESLRASLQQGADRLRDAQNALSSAAQSAAGSVQTAAHSATDWAQNHNPVEQTTSWVSPVTTTLSRIPSSLPSALIPLFFSRTLGSFGLKRSLRNPMKQSWSLRNPFTPQPTPSTSWGTTAISTLVGVGALVGAELIARRFANVSLFERAREGVLTFANGPVQDTTAALKNSLSRS